MIHPWRLSVSLLTLLGQQLTRESAKLTALIEENVIFKSEHVTHLMSFAEHVETDEAFVDLICALSHALSLYKIVSLPVTKLRVIASLLKVWWLSDD